METTKKNSEIDVLLIPLGLFVSINSFLIFKGHIKADKDGFALMVGAGLTIAIFSFLYKDNPLYKLAEHLYIGAAAAYTFHISWYDTIVREVVYPLFKPEAGVARNFWVLIPTFLGLLLFTRWIRKIEFLSKISFAFIVGFGAGLSIPSQISAYLLEQIYPTMKPLFDSTGINFDGILILIGVICVLIYFFFSTEHKGAIGKVSKVGIWFLMVSFGASFGYTVMARLSLLVGRVNFIFHDWIPLIK